MKLKSTLWALALACAAVSCSDDLENGPGSNGTDENNGQKAYLKINISTVSDGMMTKADPQPSNPNNNDDNTTNGAGWGEDGNGWLGELPGKNEGKVYDINIFLVETTETSLNSTNHLNLLNTQEDTEAGKKLLETTFAGHAYEHFDEAVDASLGGVEDYHGSRNVTVTMAKDLGTKDQRFQVFTIVNAGDLTKDITTLKQLREYVTAGGANQVIKKQEGNVAEADEFIMSTHKMYGNQGLPSIVTLSSLNTAENPAYTSVYVERLAARIDLAYPAATEGKEAGVLKNVNEDSPVYEEGTFKLTGYTVVNKWMGGTNMIKQVSPTVSNYNDEVEEDATPKNNDPMKYLGDEIWKWTNAGQLPGTYNFVLSPKFFSKTTQNISDGKWNQAVTSGDNMAYYDNYFSTNLNNNSAIDRLPTSGSYTEEGQTTAYYPIAYVRENTMNTKEQVHGFSTGVIFQTQFTPDLQKFNMTEYLSENDGDKKAGSISDEAKLTSDETFQFLTAEHYNGKVVQKLVYKDVKSVAARAFNIADGDNSNLLMGIMDGWSSTGVSTNLTLAKVKEEIEKMSEKNQLSKKFKQYLQKALSNETEEELAKSPTNWRQTLKDSLVYSKFVEDEGTAKATLLKKKLNDPTYSSTDIANLAEWYGIYYFRNGQSYHKFWIRHNDNRDDNKMGVMEFAIVRNNVYQLNVTGVRGLGDPLPFTPGKDDPEKPDESNEVTINVTIYVKDWVKRKNKDIILQ